MLFLMLSLMFAMAYPCAAPDASHAPRPKKHHVRSPLGEPARAKASGATQAAELALRRRVARLLRLSMLERREAELRDFVIAAQTETPSLADATVHKLDAGLAVGPAIVTKDFLGSPVVRVRVRNLRHVKVAALLELRVRSKDGRAGSAVTVAQLGGDEDTTVELLCPRALDAAQLSWKATAL